MNNVGYSDEDNIICPFCSEIVRDAWEFVGDEDDGYRECYNCGKIFLYEVHRSITYSSYPLELEYYTSIINRDISSYYWQFSQRPDINIDDVKKLIITLGCDHLLQYSFSKIGLTPEDIELGPDPDAAKCGRLTDTGIERVKYFFNTHIMNNQDD